MAHDTPSVRAWVRLVAGRQIMAHLAVLVVVLAAAGALLAARPGMPLSSPVLMSLVASAMVLAGSARGRGRNDRWVLGAASTAALVPVLSVAVAMSSTSSAVVAAYGFVGLGLVAIRPGRGARRPGLARSRLVRGLDVLIVIAALPLACWASGLLQAIQAWAPALLS